MPQSHSHRGEAVYSQKTEGSERKKTKYTAMFVSFYSWFYFMSTEKPLGAGFYFYFGRLKHMTNMLIVGFQQLFVFFLKGNSSVSSEINPGGGKI